MSPHTNNNNNINNANNGFGRTARDRRASFSVGTSLSDYLSSSRQPQPPGAYPSPIISAAAQASHQRRMSISGATVSPSHGQANFSLRRGSVSSISSLTSGTDESAIDDSESASGSPTSPFARRLSWGARALQVRIPRGSIPAGTPSPTISRGFWPENNNANSSYMADASLQNRRRSMPPPPVTAMPAPKEPPTDRLQERMLRNEFYMD